MIHGTHYMVSSADNFTDGKIWGPWLWYLNDGSKPDAEERAAQEFADWPYAWFEDEAYHTRGSVKGVLVLSDGRPATNASVFLGDNDPTKTALDMGSDYYYTAYADEDGNFEFLNVRAATYGFQAWSNGSTIADVTTTFSKNGVIVTNGTCTDLGTLNWVISEKTKLFQVGDFDRTEYGFLFGGAPYSHGNSENCSASLTYTVGTSPTTDWCYAQSKIGNWSIIFDVDEIDTNVTQATLIVSLAGYSSAVTSNILANGVIIGNLTSGTPELLSDPCVYRSGTTAGEWRYLEFPVDLSLLKIGSNEVTFQVTRNTTWHGFMWDSIILEW